VIYQCFKAEVLTVTLVAKAFGATVIAVGANRSGFLSFQSIFCCLRSQESFCSRDTKNFPKMENIS